MLRPKFFKRFLGFSEKLQVVLGQQLVLSWCPECPISPCHMSTHCFKTICIKACAGPSLLPKSSVFRCLNTLLLRIKSTWGGVRPGFEKQATLEIPLKHNPTKSWWILKILYIWCRDFEVRNWGTAPKLAISFGWNLCNGIINWVKQSGTNQIRSYQVLK